MASHDGLDVASAGALERLTSRFFEIVQILPA